MKHNYEIRPFGGAYIIRRFSDEGQDWLSDRTNNYAGWSAQKDDALKFTSLQATHHKRELDVIRDNLYADWNKDSDTQHSLHIKAGVLIITQDISGEGDWSCAYGRDYDDADKAFGFSLWIGDAKTAPQAKRLAMDWLADIEPIYHTTGTRFVSEFIMIAGFKYDIVLQDEGGYLVDSPILHLGKALHIGEAMALCVKHHIDNGYPAR